MVLATRLPSYARIKKRLVSSSYTMVYLDIKDIILGTHRSVENVRTKPSRSTAKAQMIFIQNRIFVLCERDAKSEYT